MAPSLGVVLIGILTNAIIRATVPTNTSVTRDPPEPYRYGTKSNDTRGRNSTRVLDSRKYDLTENNGHRVKRLACGNRLPADICNAKLRNEKINKCYDEIFGLYQCCGACFDQLIASGDSAGLERLFRRDGACQDRPYPDGSGRESWCKEMIAKDGEQSCYENVNVDLYCARTCDKCHRFTANSAKDTAKTYALLRVDELLQEMQNVVGVDSQAKATAIQDLNKRKLDRDVMEQEEAKRIASNQWGDKRFTSNPVPIPQWRNSLAKRGALRNQAQLIANFLTASDVRTLETTANALGTNIQEQLSYIDDQMKVLTPPPVHADEATQAAALPLQKRNLLEQQQLVRRIWTQQLLENLHVLLQTQRNIAAAFQTLQTGQNTVRKLASTQLGVVQLQRFLMTKQPTPTVQSELNEVNTRRASFDLLSQTLQSNRANPNPNSIRTLIRGLIDSFARAPKDQRMLDLLRDEQTPILVRQEHAYVLQRQENALKENALKQNALKENAQHQDLSAVLRPLLEAEQQIFNAPNLPPGFRDLNRLKQRKDSLVKRSDLSAREFAQLIHQQNQLHHEQMRAFYIDSQKTLQDSQQEVLTAIPTGARRGIARITDRMKPILKYLEKLYPASASRDVNDRIRAAMSNVQTMETKFP